MVTCLSKKRKKRDNLPLFSIFTLNRNLKVNLIPFDFFFLNSPHKKNQMFFDKDSLEEDSDDDEEEEEEEEEKEEQPTIKRRPGRPPTKKKQLLNQEHRRPESFRRMPAPRPKRPVTELEPPGLGPWYAFMMVNVGADEDTKKQTEVRLDTNPELVKAIKNDIDQGDWTIVLKLGPFYDLDFAGLILAEWSDGTRGPGPRIAQGLCLWERYRDAGVHLAVNYQTKQEVQKVFQARRDAELGYVSSSLTKNNHAVRVYPGRISSREILSAKSGFTPTSSSSSLESVPGKRQKKIK